MSFLSKLLAGFVGNKNENDLKEIRPIVDQVRKAWEQLTPLSHDQFRQVTRDLISSIRGSVAALEAEKETLRKQAETQPQLSDGEKEKIFQEIDRLEKQILQTLDQQLDQSAALAFAIVKETARRFKENTTITVQATPDDLALQARKGYPTIEGNTVVWSNTWLAAGTPVTWDMVHYDVQLIGGYVLHKGKISEMATGEGKTLVATLPVFLNALAGRGVHVVTVNDYLARRDSEWMAPIFEFHGLKVDCVDRHQPNSEDRRLAYQADIVYGTNNEFGFDYLRDNMVGSPDQLVQRSHHFAIIDEVDSVLIDEARTPLIISGPAPRGDHQEYLQLKPMVDKLVNAQKRVVNLQFTEARKVLSSAEKTGKDDEKKAAEFLFRAYRGLPRNTALIKFLSEPGMRSVLQKTENYYMQDQNKEMPKIDDELYFVIDEKQNSVDITEMGINLISADVDDPHFFLLPDIATELSAIDQQEADPALRAQKKDALMRDFTVKSERIHTIQQLLKAYALFERDKDYVVMDGKVKIVDEQTGRILDGRRYSDGLHQAIEAKENVKVEAATQTYATVTLQNYFRMYHKLAGMTGTAETEAKELWDIYKLDVVVIPTNKPIQRKDLNDLVYKTKREKYNAVIDHVSELVEKGRPVLVGTTSVEISELLSRMLTLRKIRHQVLNAKLHQKEAEIVAEAGKAGTVTIATNMAGRGTDIKLGEGVREAGGLAIVGTERHESRRVDRQLRGRSGRQGDPGSSVFFVSLEDDLMRLFGSERISKLMDRMGLKEGEVITHSMITKSIERAQKKVEENNFGIRKRLLEFDDVMNLQREAVYRRRRNALYGDKEGFDISNMTYELCEAVVKSIPEPREFQDIEMECLRHLVVQPPMTEQEASKMNDNELIHALHGEVIRAMDARMQIIADQTFPVIKQVYESHAQQFENISVPFTDGMKMLQVTVPLKKAYETEGREVMLSLKKSIILALVDVHWKEHLREMDDLKHAVYHAQYEQKDPLLIYKQESFTLFQQFITKINQEIIAFLMRVTIHAEAPPQPQAAPAPLPKRSEPKLQAGRGSLPGEEELVREATGAPKAPTRAPMIADEKIGRNDPCPCGSGKKYKNCHGTA